MKNSKIVKPKSKKARTKKHIALLCVVISLALMLICASYLPIVTTTAYTVASNKITDNIRICLITDFHSSNYGRDSEILLKRIDKASPDLVLMVGDIFDEKRKIEPVETLLTALAEKYSCYYTTGNHEFYFSDPEYLKAVVKACGVTVLSDEIAELTVNGQDITLCGVNDLFYHSDEEGTARPLFDDTLAKLNSDIPNDTFSILLSHRPQLADIYAKYSFDLVLSGHNHGGQIRIPFTDQGLFIPRDGFLPDYCGGELYSISDSTNMIVSRGLCRTIIPRTFNPPEIVVIDIVKQ